ncbi:MAG TPA: alpha/beta fold hydrolase [Gaiellaceae bacterium]|nr:alpha/beta fold hydrolase [Gaiellaceae bacterium]
MTSALAASNAGVRIAYELRGAGSPLLLVQGLGYPRWGWEPVVDGLAERFLVCLYDNRGIGESDVPAGPYTVPQLAGDALAVLDAAGIEQAHVVGTSLGGMVAQELALTYPDRVERLVLVCTTPGVRGVPMPEQTVRLMAEAPSLAPDVALRRFVENALAPGAPAELVDEITRRRLESPPDPAGWAAQAGAAMSFDALDRLGELSAPTLVLHGTEDAVVDPANADLLAAGIPGARLELFEGCGHLFMWEQPDRFVRVVTGFLEAE